MLNSDWSSYLFDTFLRARLSMGWGDIYECHDEEDRAYFMMLEDEFDARRITPIPHRKVSNL